MKLVRQVGVPVWGVGIFVSIACTSIAYNSHASLPSPQPRITQTPLCSWVLQSELNTLQRGLPSYEQIVSHLRQSQIPLSVHSFHQALVESTQPTRLYLEGLKVKKPELKWAFERHLQKLDQDLSYLKTRMLDRMQALGRKLPENVEQSFVVEHHQNISGLLAEVKVAATYEHRLLQVDAHVSEAFTVPTLQDAQNLLLLRTPYGIQKPLPPQVTSLGEIPDQLRREIDRRRGEMSYQALMTDLEIRFLVPFPALFDPTVFIRKTDQRRYLGGGRAEFQFVPDTWISALQRMKKLEVADLVLVGEVTAETPNPAPLVWVEIKQYPHPLQITDIDMDSLRRSGKISMLFSLIQMLQLRRFLGADSLVDLEVYLPNGTTPEAKSFIENRLRIRVRCPNC